MSVDGNMDQTSVDQEKNVNFTSEPHTVHTLQDAPKGRGFVVL